MALGLPKWVPNNLLRKHASVIPICDRIKVLACGFLDKTWFVDFWSLSSWSSLWDVQEGGLGYLTSNIPCVCDAFDEIDCHPEFLR